MNKTNTPIKLLNFATKRIINLLLMAVVMLAVTSNNLQASSSPAGHGSITVDSVSLSVENFFLAYMSKSAEERKYAELFLLGVMDATEGRTWCEYKTLKTITLRERIFVEFKKLDKSQLNDRAATVINGILSKRYPCKEAK